MAGCTIKKLLTAWIFTLAFVSINAYGYSEYECVQCHRMGSKESVLQIDVEGYMTSIHGAEIGCSDCHEAITGGEHFAGKGVGKVDCLMCHEQKNLHSQDGSVECTECHTRHAIYGADDKRSSVNWRNLRETCKACHPKQAGSPEGLSTLISFQIVSHPKQDLSRVFDKGMCVGCHQGKAAHREDGIINSQDCHKCHSPLQNQRVYLGYIHPRADWRSQPINATAAWITLIGLIGIFIFFAKVLTGFSNSNRP